MCIHSRSSIPLEIWFPESCFLVQKGRFGNQISYVYTFSFYSYYTSWNLIPVKLLSGSKGPFWDSSFLCVYICLLPYLWKFDSRKAAFWLKRAVLGITFPVCIQLPSTIPLEIWFSESCFLVQKGRFGNQISYVYTFSFYHTSWNLIPVKLLLAQKGRFGNQISYVYTIAFYHTSWNLIPVKLLSGSKGPFWESNVLCVYILLVPYLLKFDSPKASFWLKRAVLGIKFPVYMCLVPYLLKFDSRKASFWLKRAVFGNQISYVFTFALHHTSWNLISVKLLFGSKGLFWESHFLCVYTLLQQQMFTDTDKNNDIIISCARPCAFLRLPGKTHYKFTTTYSNHTFV